MNGHIGDKVGIPLSIDSCQTDKMGVLVIACGTGLSGENHQL
jgi:hypothetical protein